MGTTGVPHRWSRVLSLAGVVNLAAGGVACVYAVTVYARIHFSVPLASVCAGIITGIYLLNRVCDMQEDFVNESGRLIFGAHRWLFLSVAILLLTVTLGYLAATSRLTPFFVLLTITGVGYSFPILPWFDRNGHIIVVRLKQVPVIKQLCVAALWAGAIFVVPLSFESSPAPRTPETVLFVLTLAVATFANTFFSDIRDMPGDLLAGNVTLAHLVGKAGALRLLYGVILLLPLLGVVFVACGLVSPWSATLPGVMGLHAFLYTRLSSRHNSHEAVMEIAVDTEFLVYAGWLHLIAKVSSVVN